MSSAALSRFLSWCRKQRLIEHNPCDDLDRDERPKPGRARDHVPSHRGASCRLGRGRGRADARSRPVPAAHAPAPRRGRGASLVGGRSRQRPHPDSRRSHEEPRGPRTAAVAAGARDSREPQRSKDPDKEQEGMADGPRLCDQAPTSLSTAGTDLRPVSARRSGRPTCRRTRPSRSTTFAADSSRTSPSVAIDVDLLDQCLATHARGCSASISAQAGWRNAPPP